MLKWILQDVKRTVKSKKTYLLLTIITLSIGAFFYFYPDKSYGAVDYFNNPIFNSDTDNQLVSNHMLLEALIVELSDTYPSECPMIENYPDFSFAYDRKKCEDYNQFRVSINEIYDQLENSPTDEFIYEATLFILGKYTDGFMDYFETFDDTTKAIYRSKLYHFDSTLEHKQYISNNINAKFNDFKVVPLVTSADIFNRVAMDLNETIYLYKNSLPVNLTSYMTGGFFIANYLNQYFLLLIVIGILTIFDTFYRDYNSGVIKNILISPIKRYKYIIMKTTSSIISTLMVIGLPILITVICLFIYNGFDTYAYPIYISRTTLNSFEPVKRYNILVTKDVPAHMFSTYKNVCYLGPVSTYVSDLDYIQFQDIVPCILYPQTLSSLTLGAYIGLLTAYFILIIVFLATFNCLCSLLFNKAMFNLIFMITIIALGIILSKQFIGNDFLKLLPFTFLSPAVLLMGTVPYTLYNGIYTITVYTFIFIGLLYFTLKRKDFTF